MIRCQLRGILETLADPDFWRSAIAPPLIVVSGHRWPDTRWSEPQPSPDGVGLVEFDVTACEDCGAMSYGWRRWWGVA